jgi:hypothetical protein
MLVPVAPELAALRPAHRSGYPPAAMPGAKLQLPKRLKEKLAQSPGLHGAVLVGLDELEPWIADNKLPFFPEYTDHGPDHINEVFVTAEALIRDEAWPHVTAEDVAVLVLGILLHDCAMHLSEEGFVALLKKKEWAAPISPIDTTTWPDLWDDFLREASRFDGKKLKRLFGDTEPAKPPPLDALAMTKRDRLLVGEFLRRHHPRLAHEIALQGVPGPTTMPLGLGKVERKLADLAGLVARSHGMPLRRAVDLLPSDERRETRHVHAPFLMGVLRIADYLQIHAERAPKKLLQVSSLRSPVSVGEWRKHEAIETIHNRHDDPEALYVKALPKDGATYVGLKRLFASIQDELDDVWAVLGEVYGRVNELRDLEIMIRRLRSNLDDEEAFAKTVDYVPGHVEFQAAGADLLKLLVAPLYGNKPEIGIRELLQNAVDACRELDDYQKQRPGMSKPELTEQTADIVIALGKDEDGMAWLTVSDRGIGMTYEVIKEFFLRAGASFRNSDAWRKQHTNEYGKSRILRSGRFGVGVLAAFLLGNRIEISTRHVSQTQGVRFVAEIDDEHIELHHLRRPVGTTIRVRIVESDRLETLTKNPTRWDWYRLKYPSVLRSWPESNMLTSQKKATLPEQQSELPAEWRRVASLEFADVQWTYATTKYSEPLVCNGIIITEDLYVSLQHSFDRATRKSSANPNTGKNKTQDPKPLSFKRPALSVFDPDGHLPLNLQRNNVTSDDLPFDDNLFDDICMDFIAYTLIRLPDSPDWSRVSSYPGLKYAGNTGPRFCATRHGWTVVDPAVLTDLGPRSLCITTAGTLARQCAEVGFDNVVFIACSRKSTYDSWFRDMIAPKTLDMLGALVLFKRRGQRVLLSSEFWRRTVERKLLPRSTKAKLKIKEDTWSGGWTLLTIGDCPANEDKFHQIDRSNKAAEMSGAAEWYFSDPPTLPHKSSRFSQIWAEVVQRPVIPFDLAERRRVLIHTYEKLAPYVRAHEELLKKGVAMPPKFSVGDTE